MNIKSERHAGGSAKKANGRAGKASNQGKVAGRIGPDSVTTAENNTSKMLEFQQKSGDENSKKGAHLADKARTSAYSEAVKVNESLIVSATQADKTQWNLVAAMLRVGEFLLDDAGDLDAAKLDSFLSRHNIKRHKNTREDWRYVVKACVPENTPQDRVTLYGYVLTTTVAQGIGSQCALHEFENGAEVSGSHRVGLNRFVLQYKVEKKASAATASGAKGTNKYDAMAKPRLLKEAVLLLAALETAGVSVPGMAYVMKAIADAETALQRDLPVT